MKPQKCGSDEWHILTLVLCFCTFIITLFLIGSNEWKTDDADRSALDMVKQYKRHLSVMSLSIGGAAATLTHWKCGAESYDGASRFFKFLSSLGVGCMAFAAALFIFAVGAGIYNLQDTGLLEVIGGSYAVGAFLFLSGYVYYAIYYDPPANQVKVQDTSHRVCTPSHNPPQTIYQGTRSPKGGHRHKRASSRQRKKYGRSPAPPGQHNSVGRRENKFESVCSPSSSGSGDYVHPNDRAPPVKPVSFEEVNQVWKKAAREQPSTESVAYPRRNRHSVYHESYDSISPGGSLCRHDHRRSSDRKRNREEWDWAGRRLKEELPVGNLFLMLAFLILLSLTGYVLHEQCFRKRDIVHSKSIIPMWRPSVTTA